YLTRKAPASATQAPPSQTKPRAPSRCSNPRGDGSALDAAIGAASAGWAASSDGDGVEEVGVSAKVCSQCSYGRPSALGEGSANGASGSTAGGGCIGTGMT